MAKTNKTSVADALKVIADALTNSEKTTEKKAEPKADPIHSYAVFKYTHYLPMDYSGRYITDPDKLEQYYELNPGYRPSAGFNLRNAGAPVWTQNITKDNAALAKKAAEEAVVGLKALNGGDGGTKRSGYTVEYRVFEVKEVTA